jgi:hypothetical protein
MLSSPAFIFIVAIVIIAFGGIYLFLWSGRSINGHPMRFDPAGVGKTNKTKSWLIEGTAAAGVPISCSFVEFDERGDFLDFNQHLACEDQLKHLAKSGKLILVIYCHGWKNNSQSDDVPAFNCFLSKFATSKAIEGEGLRVHGVYLGWRGNNFRPYVNEQLAGGAYQQTVQEFQGPIVDKAYHRSNSPLWFVPENLSYWDRKGAAETRAAALPLARSIFTYAAAAKAYGGQPENRVCVMAHSFGALMLERSLGQAMTGGITMEWWDQDNPAGEAPTSRTGKLPFDFVLFVNSAAPAIYAKEMRDFLEAHRHALANAKDPDADVPVIVSLTSTADWATGLFHPLGNGLARWSPSLRRVYTTGIFGEKQGDSFPTHPGIRQSEFYVTTPGHNRYLINHWIVKADRPLPSDSSSDAIFRANLSSVVADPDVFYTSKAINPAAAWRVVNQAPYDPVTLDGMPLAMQKSNYWIVSCGKELIADHNDIWSRTATEMYAALYRVVQARRHRNPENQPPSEPPPEPPSSGEASQTAALPANFGPA